MEQENANHSKRDGYIKELMRMHHEIWGLSPSEAALDFFECGIFSREEAEKESGLEPKFFSINLVGRRRARRGLTGLR